MPGIRSDGGPGIEPIMRFLLQSRESKHDRELFFKAQVLFWLLAAIDGHAKNFSIFIEPEGRYRMTPLYDIMSAHPLLVSRQLEAKKIKMAMAMNGTNRHYLWSNIQPRHFISTARQVGFNEKIAQKIVRDMMAAVDDVIKQVGTQIPKDFPQAIAAPILAGMRKQRDRYIGTGAMPN